MTFSKVKFIMNPVMMMEEFMKHDFTVSKIELACLVEAGTGAMVHKDRPSHGLAVFLGGERTIAFDRKKIRVPKNTIVYFPKGSNYTIREEASADCCAINFQMPEETLFEPFAFRAKNLNTYLESFRSSIRIWTRKSPGYAAKVKSELYHVIYSMQAEYIAPYSSPAVIQPAIDYIRSCYDQEAISVEYLASLCGISTVHLRSMFVKTFSLPPVRYINSLRLAHAEELLLSGLYTVREICFLSGFNDESYFSREFKKHFGVSPCEYAKASRK